MGDLTKSPLDDPFDVAEEEEEAEPAAKEEETELLAVTRPTQPFTLESTSAEEEGEEEVADARNVFAVAISMSSQLRCASIVAIRCTQMSEARARRSGLAVANNVGVSTNERGRMVEDVSVAYESADGGKEGSASSSEVMGAEKLSKDTP